MNQTCTACTPYTYFLAVDIGASSGRLILSHLEEGQIKLEEIHRFPNGFSKKGEFLCWNLPALFAEILTGLKKCKVANKVPLTMGIDTWGVDFVLLDSKDQILGDTVSYRDNRTQGMAQKVYELIPEDTLYQRTGIQYQPFNTIYQLMALKESSSTLLEKAETLLMIPDYLHFLLTGKKCFEYTNATTTGLVNASTKTWDSEIIETLGYPSHLFKPLSLPGTIVGPLSEEIAKEVGFNLTVILPATHDTASAVLAVPSETENSIYISSGTWSLMGIQSPTPYCSLESKLANFTNEGGYNYRFRYLKNIMGLWMIQSLKKELAPEMSFDTLCKNAAKESISSIVDCNAPCFLAPDSMTKAIQDYCSQTHQAVPKTIYELAAVTYNSLTYTYQKTIEELQSLTKQNYTKIHIVGGGCQAGYLNQLTTQFTGLPVLAGPVEATAIGNLVAQMLALDVFKDVSEAKRCIKSSFPLETYVHHKIL